MVEWKIGKNYCKGFLVKIFCEEDAESVISHKRLKRKNVSTRVTKVRKYNLEREW